MEANRSELRELVTVYTSEARMHTDLKTADLRREMAELRSELKVEMAELRTELKGEMAELREETRAGFAAIDTRFAKQETAFGLMMQTQQRWMVGLWATSTVALVAAILGAFASR